jgi:hypothetical protein
MRPGCSTTNRRLLPSRALVTSTGLERFESSGSASRRHSLRRRAGGHEDESEKKRDDEPAR